MSVFQSKHYRVIAKAIDESRDPRRSLEFILVRHLVTLLAFYFSQDNPKFNDSAFRIACGEQQEKP